MSIFSTTPTMFSFVCLARLWIAWGINPLGVIGLDAGEYTAACVAGVLSLEDALKLQFERAKFTGEIRLSSNGLQSGFLLCPNHPIHLCIEGCYCLENSRLAEVGCINSTHQRRRCSRRSHSQSKRRRCSLRSTLHAGLAVALQADPESKRRCRFRVFKRVTLEHAQFSKH